LPDLYAFKDGRLAGVFSAIDPASQEARFEPADSRTLISLSLPPGRLAVGRAPYAYLDNLLPDDDLVREAWARQRGITPDVASLLAEFGRDVAGALVLVPDPELPEPGAEPLWEATEDDIAYRIVALGDASSSWLDPRAKPRLSLGGQQGKFSIVQVGGQRFWPTWEHPSTHIFKPPSRRLGLVARYEAAALALARDIGLPASQADVVEVLDQPTLVVERWDRAGGVRLHAEDLCQASGRLVSEKYQVAAPELAQLLGQYGQAEPFVRQLAFNVAIGNTDAHAKNYSVLLHGNQPTLAPLYDTVPVSMYGTLYDDRLAMPVGRARSTSGAGENAWRTFARQARLDPDETWAEASRIMESVAEQWPDRMAALGLDAARLRHAEQQARAIRRALRSSP
jgi:serine/threonine-protein kinase HipA